MERSNEPLPRLRRRPRPLKRACNIVALIVLAPSAFTCWLERRLSTSSQFVFSFWTHVVAVLPGLPGVFLRRAFYRWTLQECAEEVSSNSARCLPGEARGSSLACTLDRMRSSDPRGSGERPDRESGKPVERRSAS